MDAILEAPIGVIIVISEGAGLKFRQCCPATLDNVRASERLDIIALVKQIGAEQSAMGFLEKHTRVPSVRQLRRGIVTKAFLTRTIRRSF